MISPEREVMNTERVYKTMRNTGTGCIALGIIIAVTGLTVGVISIVSGALPLKRKSEIEFQQAGSIMIRNTIKRQKLGQVLFIPHLCFLVYFVFFSESFGRTDTGRGYRYNLVPFGEITRYFRHYDVLGPTLFMINMMRNVVALMPFRFFLPVISRRSRK